MTETINTFIILIKIYVGRRKTSTTQTYIEYKSKTDLPNVRRVLGSVKVYK